MIIKFKNKKTCKKLRLVNSQKGGSKNPYGFNPKKVTTKNIKKVIQSAFLNKFHESYINIPGNLDKTNKFKWKNYSKAYKEYIGNLNSNLQHLTPRSNKLFKAYKRMNKFLGNKKIGLNEIFHLLHNKTNNMRDFAKTNQTKPESQLQSILSKDLTNWQKYGTRVSKDKHKEEIISKIVSVLRPQSV